MAPTKQSAATKIKKPQRGRARPGTQGGGAYFHIIVRPKRQFTSFRTQDIGREGHTQRVAGQRSGGSWATHKWLISKHDTRVVNNTLVADDPSVRAILDTLQTTPVWHKGDVFTARPRKNVPERVKPTEAQLQAWRENIKKAQAARWKTWAGKKRTRTMQESGHDKVVHNHIS
ncbi:MAG: hypothetical protein OXR66_04870 [Candidatus Woesearchaeota archaeon]|nr:hypothetical protein [Candidatus Woesearchaeota archaeon]